MRRLMSFAALTIAASAALPAAAADVQWFVTLHRALTAAEERGDIDYTFSESVAPTDYIRVLREYAEAGEVDLIVGEAFGIEQQVREVAADIPKSPS